MIKPGKCDECPIRHRAVCASCDDSEIGQLETLKYYTTFDAGQPIMWSGDRMPFVGSVVSGVATIEQLMEDGRKQTMGLLLPSDFIGRPGRETAPYDVTAVTDVTLCCFRRKGFEAMVGHTPHLSERMLVMALDELDAAREWMLLLGRKTAKEKIATFLLMIMKRTSPEGTDNTVIQLPLTREATADYLGLTIETVSRQFSALKKAGTIKLETNRRVVILDRAGLVNLSGSTEP